MVAYGVVIGITIFIYVFLYAGVHYAKEYVDRVTIGFFFICYFLLLSLRDYSIGVDTKHYIDSFNLIRHLDWKTALASGVDRPAFIVLEKIVGLVGGERLFLIVCSAIMVFPIMYFYKNEAEGSMFCISFFLNSLIFEVLFSGMRQGITIALAVPAYYMAKKKKIIPFILVVIFAFLFHRAGIMLAFIYPFYHAKITKKWLWVVIPFFVFSYFRRYLILQLIFTIAGEDYTYNYEFLTGQSGQFGLMILFILLAIYSYIFLDEELAGEEEIGLRNLLLLAAFIHMLTPLHPVISRINYYFILFIPAAITRINNRRNEKLYQVGTIATYFLPVFFFVYFFVGKSDSLGVLDYKFIF